MKHCNKTRANTLVRIGDLQNTFKLIEQVPNTMTYGMYKIWNISQILKKEKRKEYNSKA